VVTDGRGAQWIYQHNDAEQLLLATDPLGYRSAWDYDGDGRLVRSTDQCGHETTILFDASGRAAGKVSPDGSAWLVSERKDAVSMISPCGAHSAYGFRNDGLISGLTRNGQGWWRFGYGPDGRVGQILLPGGKEVQCLWSPDGRLLEERDDEGVRASYRFDLLDRLVSHADAEGGVTLFSYDSAGYLAQVEHPDHTTRRFEHDARGRITKLIDEAGNVTRWRIDAAGRRFACQAANSDTYMAFFDREDCLTDIGLPGGLEHHYRYDLRGKVIEQQFGDGRRERYEWDRRGLPIAIHDASGPVMRAEYDAASRPVAFDYADGTRKEVSYDADGRWVQVLHAGHRRRRELSPSGEPLAEWQDEVPIFRKYDDLGRCLVVSDRLGQELEYGYDREGRVTRVTVSRVQWPQEIASGDAEAAGGRVTQKRTHHFEYDRRGHRIAWHAPSGTSESCRFDARGRLTLQRIASHDRVVVERRYRYDPLGRVVELSDSRRGRFGYRYDGISRLVEVEYPDGCERFGWTPAGGVLLPNSSYQRGQMITQARGWTLDHDDRGFLVERRSRSMRDVMQYSSNGLLRGIACSDGSRHRFTYDGHARLLSWASLSSARRFLWDREQLWAWFDADAPAAAMWFVQLAGELQPIEQNNGVDAWTVHTDHNGRVCELIDSAGKVAWENAAHVWGDTVDSAAGANVSSEAGIECLLGLPGQLRHPGSGLFYNRHRWYFAETAHYLTPDPTGLWGGFDAYAYANDPVNRNDPLGLQCRGRTDDPALYRADRRPPDQICNEGFQQWNPSGTMSLADHVNGSNSTSPWISTTYNRQFANDASGYGSRHDADINKNYPGRAGPWVYEIVNPGCGVEVDCDPGVIAHAAQFGDSASEQEIAFRKPIPPGNIVGAVNLDTGEIFMCP
jgi:RHS repeat-associated protein